MSKALQPQRKNCSNWDQFWEWGRREQNSVTKERLLRKRNCTQDMGIDGHFIKENDSHEKLITRLVLRNPVSVTLWDMTGTPKRERDPLSSALYSTHLLYACVPVLQVPRDFSLQKIFKGVLQRTAKVWGDGEWGISCHCLQRLVSCADLCLSLHFSLRWGPIMLIWMGGAVCPFISVYDVSQLVTVDVDMLRKRSLVGRVVSEGHRLECPHSNENKLTHVPPKEWILDTLSTF